MSHSQLPGRQRVLLIADTLHLNQTAIFAELALYLSLLNQGFQVLCLLPEDLFSRGYELQPEPPELSYHWILLKLKLPFFWGQKFISGMPETVSPSVLELSELLSSLQPPLSGEILTRQANDLRRFYHCLDRLCRDFEPEQVIVYRGDSLISGLAMAFFRQLRIPIWSYALPRPQQICFFENQSQTSWKSQPADLALRRWDTVPLRCHQLESLKQAWLADFSVLGPLLKPAEPVSASPGLIFWQGQTETELQLSWLRSCLTENVKTLPQCWWVIALEGDTLPLAELQDLPFQFWELDLQQWLDETPDFDSIALIYHSEIALACIALGLRVMQGGPASPWDLGLDLSPEALIRLAWRRGFSLRLRMPIPIEPLEILEPEDCQLSAKSWFALKSGLHPGFAQIGQALRAKSLPFLSPERYEALRSEAEEQYWHHPGTELFFSASGSDWGLFESSVAVPHTPLPARLICSAQTAAQQGQKPKISVVVPCYNFAAFVEEAAQSILNQTFLNWEMILVNDGSTDQTAQICRELIAGFPDRAIWLLDQPNAGQPAITINNGIERACGEYIQVLSGDDWLSPNFLASSAQILDNYPNLSIAYGYQQNFGKDTEFHPASSEYRLSNLTFYNFIGSASLFRKTAWEAVKGIQTDVIGYEDWDFWIACGKNVHFGKSNPEAIFYYRTHFTESLLARQSKKDRQLKSQIILHHPSLYTESQRQWALAAQADPEGQNDPANKFAVMPHFKEPLPLYLQILDRHYQTFALSPQKHDIWESVLAMFLNTRQREFVLAYRLSPHVEEALQPIQQGQPLSSALVDLPLHPEFSGSALENTEFLALLQMAEWISVRSEACRLAWLPHLGHSRLFVLPPTLPQDLDAQLATPSLVDLQTERPLRLIVPVFLSQTNPWLAQLLSFLTDPDLAQTFSFVLIGCNLSTDDLQTFLEDVLAERAMDPESLPDLLLMELADFQGKPLESLRLAQVYLRLEGCDPLGEWILWALSLACPVLNLEPWLGPEALSTLQAQSLLFENATVSDTFHKDLQKWGPIYTMGPHFILGWEAFLCQLLADQLKQMPAAPVALLGLGTGGSHPAP